MADGATANGGSFLETTKASMVSIFSASSPQGFALETDSIFPDAAAAYNSVTQGPVAQNFRDETAKTTTELSNLYAARRTPANPAATGQPLTHYHSFFSELLSWNNPRASGLAYAAIVTAIFASRYVNFLGILLRLSYLTLGITVAAEATGKLLFNNGFASQLRPHSYYLVSRETFDALVGDVHELANFFVIEAQRILFAENLTASFVTALSAFISYYLVKVVPTWGLTLIATTVVFFVPLIYTSNQEIIDEQLKNASEVLNAQTAQVRSVAQQQASHVSALTQKYAGDYTAKVQEMLHIRGGVFPTPEKPVPAAKEPEFPTPPTEEPVAAAPAAAPEEPVVPEKEPMIAS
ncbi:Reticulon-domain-containing protein [Stachybotrys elegans]|uniref:Reticulon-like protein n=1 Tax=Stachybotrys elegans TaxID=80388 RepID=A0A8K0T688_9HYPO|nr:Reticulon-domain-containing protein [Stachybotrys elegans]